MNKNAIWLVLGGLAVGAVAVLLLRRRKSGDETMTTAIVERDIDFDVPSVPQPKTAGQTIAESFGVILRRKEPRQPKAPKPKKQAA